MYLCDNLTPEIEVIKRHPANYYVTDISNDCLQLLLKEIKKGEIQSAVIYHKNFEKLQKKFWKLFNVIQAGGGLVKNIYDEVLLIFRRGVWDLPKGKLDKHETIEQCAVREVQEETGLSSLKIIKKLNITYHTYVENGKHYLKESHWFMMRAKKKENLVPQAEEGITDIRWVSKEEINDYIKNSFATIASVLQHA